MKNGDIQVNKCKVAKLLRDVDAGQFAIPKLQREFVWDGPKAAKLLDSILRAMPIGVILIWDTPKSQRLHLREKYHVLPPFNHSNPSVWFLIDGQQRVSVLHHVRLGDQLKNARRQGIDFSRVVLSLKQEDDSQKKSVPTSARGRICFIVDRIASAVEAEAERTWKSEARAGPLQSQPYSWL